MSKKSKKVFTTKLSDIAFVEQGQSPESEFYSDSEGVPFLQGNRSFGSLYPSFDTYTKKVTKLAKKGDVLMSVRAPVGALNIAPCNLCIGRGLASIRAKNGNNKFIYYALKYNVGNLIKQGTATTFDSVNKDMIYDFELIIPESETERNKIASVLSIIDSKIELNNDINTELENLAKTIYNYWFVQFDFPNEEGKPYKTSGGEMVWNEELKREIPKGWKDGKLNDLIEIHDSKRIPLSNKQRENRKGEYPYYGATEIMDYIDGYIFDGTFVLMAEDGSVMDKNGNPVLQYIWGKSWVNNHAHVLEGKKVSNEFLHLMLKNIPVIQIMSGSIQKKINQENLKNTPVLIIPENLLNKFDEIIRPLYSKIKNIFEQNQELIKLRDFLLPLLMTGQVKVKSEVNEELSMAAEPQVKYWK
jgi:type I restriction enzyme S subunit